MDNKLFAMMIKSKIKRFKNITPKPAVTHQNIQ